VSVAGYMKNKIKEASSKRQAASFKKHLTYILYMII
jgi:hypothetical protein